MKTRGEGDAVASNDPLAGAIAGSSSSRSTQPEIANATRTTHIGDELSTVCDDASRKLTADEADAHAARIRPSWLAPSFRSLRPAPSGGSPPPEFAAGLDSDLLPHTARLELEADQHPAASPPWLAPRAASTWDAERDADAEAQAAEVPERPRLRGVLIAFVAIVALALVCVLALFRNRNATSDAQAGKTMAAALRETPPVTAQQAQSRLTTETPAVNERKPAAMIGRSTPPMDGAIASVRVRITANPPRARIRVDGHGVSNPYDARMPKGERHRVLVQAPGYELRDITLAGQGDESIRVDLLPLPLPPE